MYLIYSISCNDNALASKTYDPMCLVVFEHSSTISEFIYSSSSSSSSSSSDSDSSSSSTSGSGSRGAFTPGKPFSARCSLHSSIHVLGQEKYARNLSSGHLSTLPFEFRQVKKL